MRVLVYGSHFLTEVAVRHMLKCGIDVVGHVPSVHPTFPGNVPVPEVGPENVMYDLLLSICYDRRIYRPGYNIHTGLLPRWGGCDILYHTKREQAREQGLTLHRMALSFDSGPIFCKATYPVFPHDRIVDLFEKLTITMPNFAVTCVRLLEKEPLPTFHDKGNRVTLYKRGWVLPADAQLYEESGMEIREFIKGWSP